MGRGGRQGVRRRGRETEEGRRGRKAGETDGSLITGWEAEMVQLGPWVQAVQVT